MKFLLTFQPFETLTQEQVMPIGVVFVEGLRQLGNSPKVKDWGIFGNRRGGYFILEVDSAEEIAETLGPEVMDNGYVETYAIVEDLERVGQAFSQWAQQGR